MVRVQQGTDFENQTHWEREYEKEMRGRRFFKVIIKRMKQTMSLTWFGDDVCLLEPVTQTWIPQKVFLALWKAKNLSRRGWKEEKSCWRLWKLRWSSRQRKASWARKITRASAHWQCRFKYNTWKLWSDSVYLKAQREITKKYSNTDIVLKNLATFQNRCLKQTTQKCLKFAYL